METTYRRTNPRKSTIECPVVSSGVVPANDDYVVRHRAHLWAEEDTRITSTCLPCVALSERDY